jgi:MFS family permease
MPLALMVSHNLLRPYVPYTELHKASGAPLGAVFGYLLSGIIANYASWKWLFWVLSIFAAFITIAGIIFVPSGLDHIKERSPEVSLAKSVDWIGGALITGGLIALLFSLTEGNVVGWSSTWIYMLLMIAFLLIGMFIAWEWYLENHTDRPPLMKMSMFHNLLFSTAMVIMAVCFGVVGDFNVYASYLWQDYEAQSPIQTALRFVPAAVCGVIVAIIVSRLISKVPGYMMLLTGQLALSVACLLMAAPIRTNVSYFACDLIAMILSVIGADTAWPILTLFTSKSLPEEYVYTIRMGNLPQDVD